MTPSKRAKELGAPSLPWVAEQWGCTARNLESKFKSNPKQFEIIVVGVMSIYHRNALVCDIESVISRHSGHTTPSK